jgi:hypothetical protein
MWPVPLSSAYADASHGSERGDGSDILLVTGVLAMNVPEEKPIEQPTDQLAPMIWFGLAVTVTVMMTGLPAGPPAAHIANSP